MDNFRSSGLQLSLISMFSFSVSLVSQVLLFSLFFLFFFRDGTKFLLLVHTFQTIWHIFPAYDIMSFLHSILSLFFPWNLIHSS